MTLREFISSLRHRGYHLRACHAVANLQKNCKICDSCFALAVLVCWIKSQATLTRRSLIDSITSIAHGNLKVESQNGHYMWYEGCYKHGESCPTQNILDLAITINQAQHRSNYYVCT